MAQFGVTTAMVSIVLSVFMVGLGLGSWASGQWLRRGGDCLRLPALRLYALVELLIGVSGILVPYELVWGRNILERLDLSSSLSYYSASGLWAACTLVPWCALMGATIPVGMWAIGQTRPREAERSFSYLYMANVAGAVAGTALPLLLIELLGFSGTLRVGAACNCVIAATAIVFSRTSANESSANPAQSVDRPGGENSSSSTLLVLLFLTGLTSMGMEVVWVRQFTPYLGTVVYAFASILGVYLAATFIGSSIYRRWSLRHVRESPVLWTLLALSALFPLVTSNPNILMADVARVVLGIAFFTGLLGFLTPMLVDRWSRGDPGEAGNAYAINVLGCVLGPLLAGFGLLPHLSERTALIVLSLPWLAVGLCGLRPNLGLTTAARGAASALLPLALMFFFAGRGYDERYPQRQVLSDATATVIATGSGMQKQLLVNGYGMTTLTPFTKMMAHLPLVFLDHPPQDVLDICFGMGTTFRSLLSWNINTTAVELVPSVPKLFGYFHSDGPELIKSSLAHIVVDDGRRYLERTTQQYDIITIDPPPPVEAAGSSMLYSKEFYASARKRLRTGGILAQWLPNGDAEDFASVARALRNSFGYVRVFRYGDNWGYHFLASEQPLSHLTAWDLQRRMPDSAVTDFTEWTQSKGRFTVSVVFDNLLRNEIPIEAVIALSPATPTLSDDRPINEYYLLRRRVWRH
jgi:spermidine synthase